MKLDLQKMVLAEEWESRHHEIRSSMQDEMSAKIHEVVTQNSEWLDITKTTLITPNQVNAAEDQSRTPEDYVQIGFTVFIAFNDPSECPLGWAVTAPAGINPEIAYRFKPIETANRLYVRIE